jgi:hypothetical protein
MRYVYEYFLSASGRLLDIYALKNYFINNYLIIIDLLYYFTYTYFIGYLIVTCDVT